MRLVTYRHPEHGEAQAGIVQGDRVLSVAGLRGETEPVELLTVLDWGPEALGHLAGAAERFAAEHQDAIGIPPEIAVPLWTAELLAPLPRPRSFRDFYAFEQHVATANRKRGREVPPAWYEIPVFYFSNAGSILGPDAQVRRPAGCQELDFELEVACVIGLGGRDIPAERAWEHVAGLTILNDWSARDLQRQEMSVGLGPAKGKDFATSIGPYLVTLDELTDRFTDDRHDLTMVARIDGEEVSRGNLRDLYWTFPQMIVRASRDADLRPGDLIGSGTVGTGCILELGVEVHPWLEPGNEVELEVERLGRLRNVVAE